MYFMKIIQTIEGFVDPDPYTATGCITLNFDDYEEMISTASSLISAGAIVILGRAE